MKRLNAWLFLLSVPFLCGCDLDTVESTGGMDMEEWCSRDEKRPWTGCWIEVARLDCASGQEFVPEDLIGEFRLMSDGRFSLTWSPFEHFVDYAGQYEVSQKDGAIELTMGDRAPPNVDWQGRYAITEEGALLLESIWLGTREQENSTAACGHRFRRQ